MDETREDGRGTGGFYNKVAKNTPMIISVILSGRTGSLVLLAAGFKMWDFLLTPPLRWMEAPRNGTETQQQHRLQGFHVTLVVEQRSFRGQATDNKVSGISGKCPDLSSYLKAQCLLDIHSSTHVCTLASQQDGSLFEIWVEFFFVVRVFSSHSPHTCRLRHITLVWPVHCASYLLLT